MPIERIMIYIGIFGLVICLWIGIAFSPFSGSIPPQSPTEVESVDPVEKPIVIQYDYLWSYEFFRKGKGRDPFKRIVK